MRAAVPAYMGHRFEECPPGHRFGLYFPVWKDDWSLDKEGKGEALKQTLSLPRHAQDTLAALRERQAMLLDGIPEVVRLSIEAKTTAPFATGLGLAHPLENGFAFLNPYGLPYLPGSGVKGVIRRAAQELADGMWEDSRGWSHELRYTIEVGSGKDKRTIQLSMLDVLFGREPASGDSDHLRGALTFWDVIPQIEGDALAVEIMTPHQSHYYQQQSDPKSGRSTTPHESGQPTPITFLTVPPQSLFVFHVTCDTARLGALAADLAEADAEGKPRWQALVEAAFAHAFRWLGFGAKTAVGYGAMQIQEHSEENHAPNAVPHVPAQATPQVETGEEVWSSAELHYNPSTREITASFEGKKSAGLTGEALERLLTALGERTVKLKKNKKLNNIPIRVCVQGNLIKIIGLANEGV